MHMLGIWLVPCRQVPNLNPPTRDAIHDYAKASLGFHRKIISSEKKQTFTYHTLSLCPCPYPFILV